MERQSEQPFDSIESAYDFFRLLSEAVAEAKQDIDEQIQGQVQRESGSQSSRRLDALRVVHYSVEKLEFHIHCSRRILNDLRSLRRLLFEERAAVKDAVASQAAVASPPVKTLLPRIPAEPVPAALHPPVAKVARARAKAGRPVAA
jgi:hypothetical protein